MKLAEVMVVLVILVLCNIALTWYLLTKINDIENTFQDRLLSLDYKVENIKQRSDMQNEGIIMSFNKWYEYLKRIPKEIVVKNVLNIP